MEFVVEGEGGGVWFWDGIIDAVLRHVFGWVGRLGRPAEPGYVQVGAAKSGISSAVGDTVGPVRNVALCRKGGWQPLGVAGEITATV